MNSKAALNKNCPLFLSRHMFVWFSSGFKDTHRENTSPNKTESLTKSMNMYIWEIGTLNQLFIRGSYTHSC